MGIKSTIAGLLTPGGAAPLVLRIGDAQSRDGVSMAVR